MQQMTINQSKLRPAPVLILKLLNLSQYVSCGIDMKKSDKREEKGPNKNQYVDESNALDQQLRTIRHLAYGFKGEILCGTKGNGSGTDMK